MTTPPESRLKAENDRLRRALDQIRMRAGNSKLSYPCTEFTIMDCVRIAKEALAPTAEEIAAGEESDDGKIRLKEPERGTR